MPIPNRDTLRALLAFLAKVAENADDIVTGDGEKVTEILALDYSNVEIQIRVILHCSSYACIKGVIASP